MTFENDRCEKCGCFKSKVKKHICEVNYWKGKHRSKETMEKLRLSNLGRPSKFRDKTYEEIYGKEKADEIRRKSSLSHKGQLPWIAGKHHTKEAIEKSRLSRLGKPSKKKGRTYEELYGKEKSQKIIEKMSKQREKPSKNIGKHHSEESILKMVETKKRLYADGSIIAWNKIPEDKKPKLKCEQCGKIIITIPALVGKKRFCSLQCRNDKGRSIKEIEKISRCLIKRWQNPEWREKVIKSQLKGHHILPNKPELKLDEIIHSITPFYLYVGDGGKFSKVEPVVINGRIPDWINNNGEKKVILHNGIYWHLWRLHKKYPNLTKEDVEKMINADYEKFGYKVLHIWEDELSDKEAVANKIKKFVG